MRLITYQKLTDIIVLGMIVELMKMEKSFLGGLEDLSLDIQKTKLA
jgi:hypothetical protein